MFVLLRPRGWKQQGCRERAVARKMASVHNTLYVREELAEGSMPLASNAEKTLDEMRAEVQQERHGSWGRHDPTPQ